MNVLACPSIKKKMHCIKMINEHRIRNKFIIKKKLLVYIYNMNNQMIKKNPLMTEILGQEISSFTR